MGKMRGLNLRSRFIEGVLLLEFTYHREPGPRRLREANRPDGVLLHRAETNFALDLHS